MEWERGKSRIWWGNLGEMVRVERRREVRVVIAVGEFEIAV